MAPGTSSLQVRQLQAALEPTTKPGPGAIPSKADYAAERQVEYMTRLGDGCSERDAAEIADAHIDDLKLQRWSDEQ